MSAPVPPTRVSSVGWAVRPMDDADAKEVLAIYQAGIWTVQCGVFPENAASLALHAKVGFRRERLGRHHGIWRDVLLLERRSPVVC